MTTAVFPRAFRIAEAAKALGIHPGSIRRAERLGRIPRARREPVSGQRVYTEQDVQALRERLYGR